MAAADRDDKHDYDYVIIGSGFGGSVAALRLAEKGYSVAVLERGRRYAPADFPATNFNAPKFLWAPSLFCYGIQAFTQLRDVTIMHGTGVGGGSLVYANTLLCPPDEVFESAAWRQYGDWKQDLAPHFATARRMLGVAPASAFGKSDHLLKEIAADMGRADTFHSTDVGVFFGEPDKTVPDPYFDGQGRERTGCTLCGGCMVGCRKGAKNSLDKNYLYFAERRGAQIIAETEVRDVRALDGGGYEVHTRRQNSLWVHPRRVLRCRGLVIAGGVLGTLPLLLSAKQRGSLPRLSNCLGTYVRTNSEAMIGVTTHAKTEDYSQGIGIASGFHPDDKTYVEIARYGKGQDFIGLLTTFFVPDAPPWPRWIRWLAAVLAHPIKALRHLLPFGFATRSAILLVMQTVDNHMQLRLRRPWWWPFSRRLDSTWAAGEKVPRYLPVAHRVAASLAAKMHGDMRCMGSEILFNVTSTGHIMGGCPIGSDSSNGVIDKYGRVFGYDNLYVVDGSVITNNLGVNPSLTITAFGEWFMSHIPTKNRSAE